MGAVRIAAIAVVAAAALASGGCATSGPAGAPATSSTRPAPPLPVARPTAPAAPGTIIATQDVTPPLQARAWRVDHHSTSAGGEDIGVRSLLVVPAVPPPDGGFPLVVWGHPTKGVADECAPSLDGAAAIPLIDELVRAGYAVVATDYEGLGAEGPSPYLVGPSEGHTMLDSARAARGVKGAGITERSPVLLWGFSQGGHAALFAAELAATYAPELPIVGVAAAAPVSDVAHFARRSEDWQAQLGVLVTITAGFHAAYPELDLGDVLTPEGIAALPELEQRCITEVNQYFDQPIAGIVRRTPRDLPGWSGRLEESRAGQRRLPAPLLVIQGDADDIVDPKDTTTMVANYCRLGVPVEYVVRRGENHGVLTSDALLPWLADRLAGRPAPTSCLGDVLGTGGSRPGTTRGPATKP